MIGRDVGTFEDPAGGGYGVPIPTGELPAVNAWLFRGEAPAADYVGHYVVGFAFEDEAGACPAAPRRRP